MNPSNNKKDDVRINVPWADPKTTSVSGASFEPSPEDGGGEKKKQPIELVGVRDLNGEDETTRHEKEKEVLFTKGAVPVKANIVPARVETVPAKATIVSADAPSGENEPVSDGESEKKQVVGFDYRDAQKGGAPGKGTKPNPEKPAVQVPEKKEAREKPAEQRPADANAEVKPEKQEKKDEKKIEVPAKPEKKIERSEADKVKIAELLYGAIVPFNDKEMGYYLGRLEKDFSPRAIQEAARFIGIRDEAEGVIADLKKLGKPDEMITHRMLVRDNKYAPALIDLKRTLLEEKRKELEAAFKGNPDLEEIIKEKLFLGRDGRGEGAYERNLLRMMVTELERDIGVHERVQALENPSGAGFIRKARAKIARMPRPLKAILGAGVVGAGVAAFAPTMVVGAVPTYLLYRTIRAGTGGVFAAGIQKYIGNPFAQRKLKKYLEGNQKEVLGRAYRDIGERGYQGRSLLEEFAETKRYQDVARRNFEISQRYAAELHNLRKQSEKKYGKVLMATSVASGIVGGYLGGAAFDAIDHYIFGPGATVLAGGGIVHHPDVPQKPGVSDWNLETAQPGDSVWRVVEHDLQHNVKGFDQLPKAQQTYLIDHYKDLVAADPEKFGLHNPNLIQPGWGKELHSLFDGPQGQEELAKWMGNAGHLSPEQMQHILEYNAKPSIFHPEMHGGAGTIPEVPVQHGGVPASVLAGGSVHDAIGGGGVEHALQTGGGAATEHALSRADVLLDLHTTSTHLAEEVNNFPHYSAAQQEYILNSPKMASITNELHQLNRVGTGLTGSEVNVMAEVNKSWGAMQQAYLENMRHLTGTLRGATGLNAENTRDFLSGTVDKVLDKYQGNSRVLDFMRSINPTSDELAAHRSISEVLKNRFVDGHFGKVNIDQYVSGGWTE